MTESLPIQIIFAPDFQTQLRRLAKRYRSIQTDLQPFLDEIQSCPESLAMGTQSFAPRHMPIAVGRAQGVPVPFLPW
jgi:hypothetical protein